MSDLHLPTPFTADEIRDATPDGHTIDILTEELGTVSRHRTTFTECTADGAVIRTVALDATGAEAGEPVVGRSTWVELQAHASFPAEATVRSSDTLDTPLGRLDCLRYELRRGDDVMVFWFATELPGMPVHHSTVREGEPVSVTTVTAMSGVG